MKVSKKTFDLNLKKASLLVIVLSSVKQTEIGHSDCAGAPVLLFSNLNRLFPGYFDPENIFLDNTNN